MRITFVLPGLDMSGGNRIVAEYAWRLQAAGHVVNVLVAGRRPPGLRETLRDLLRGRYRAGGGWGPSHFDGLPLRPLCLAPGIVVDDRVAPDADVVIATWWETAEWVQRLSPAKGAKVYFVQHHEVFDYLPVDRVHATYRLPMHKIVVARWLADVMRERYGDPQVDVVDNATDHRVFHAPVRDKQPRPTVGLMVSSTPFKGLDVAIAALRRVHQHLPDLRVVSFGHEAPRGLEFLGPALEHEMAPAQSRIRECYARCDAWLMASRSEGFGLPALEAMACRTPVVSTRAGWPAGAVQPGVNGQLADVDDDAGLAAGLLQVLQATPDQWRAMSDAAARTAAELTWERVVPRFVAALERARSRRFPVPAPGAGQPSSRPTEHLQ